MIYIGIDPSFTNTGVCYFDPDNKKIKFVGFKPKGTNDSYKDTLDRSAKVALTILKQSDLTEDTTVIIEEPLMKSMKASSLGILSGVVIWTLAFMPNIVNIYSINPRYISSVNSDIRKSLKMSKKDASRHVASEILSYLKEELDYSVEIYNDKTNKDGSTRQRVLSHDEAEAFIFVISLLIDLKFFNNQQLKKIVLTNKKLLGRKNITLIKGELSETFI
jgi:hypothetical protein